MKKLMYILATVLLLSIVACGKSTSTVAAPIGSDKVLETLATAFQEQSDRLSQSPSAQSPADKKAFVEAVFQRAGYDYGTTLRAQRRENFDSADQLHRDLAELLLYPTAGYSIEDAAKIYSPTDLEHIKDLKSWVR